MSRKVVPLINGERYHVYNRGVDKRIVFEDRHDYLRFYQSLIYFNNVKAMGSFRMAKVLYKSEVKPLVNIHAYCLLPNHYHLLLSQVESRGVSDFVKRLSGGYTGYFNEKYNRSGVLFQGRFKRVHVENDKQNQYLIAYINENHFVHNTSAQRQLYNTSSFHYQKLKTSKAISNDSINYNIGKAQSLAIDIYNKRHSHTYLLE